MSIEDRLSTIQSQLDELRSEVEAQIEAQASTAQIDLGQHPEVRQAAQALAEAIARAQGHTLPLQFAPGVDPVLPVMQIPEGFQKYGGIGIGVMVAPPTEAASAEAY